MQKYLINIQFNIQFNIQLDRTDAKLFKAIFGCPSF